jgi:hypothetical protein
VFRSCSCKREARWRPRFWYLSSQCLLPNSLRCAKVNKAVAWWEGREGSSVTNCLGGLARITLLLGLCDRVRQGLALPQSLCTPSTGGKPGISSTLCFSGGEIQAFCFSRENSRTQVASEVSGSCSSQVPTCCPDVISPPRGSQLLCW